MKGETGWNWMYSMDVQEYLFLCLGLECSILFRFRFSLQVYVDWMRPPKLQNVREDSPPGAGNRGWWQILQLIQTCKHFLPFISLHEIPAQTFPMDLHKFVKWKISAKRCLPQEGKEGLCVFHRDPSAGLKLPSQTVHSRHMNKTYGLNIIALKTALNFHHQPPTNCFANTCVLQHVPVADCCDWLHILRTK